MSWVINPRGLSRGELGDELGDESRRIKSESRIFSIDLNLALYFLSDAMNIAHAGALAAHLVGRCITYSACSRGMMQGHSRYDAQSSLANSV